MRSEASKRRHDDATARSGERIRLAKSGVPVVRRAADDRAN